MYTYSGSKLPCSTRCAAASTYMAKSPTGRVGTASTHATRKETASATTSRDIGCDYRTRKAGGWSLEAVGRRPEAVGRRPEPGARGPESRSHLQPPAFSLQPMQEAGARSPWAGGRSPWAGEPIRPPASSLQPPAYAGAVSYTHLRAHE